MCSDCLLLVATIPAALGVRLGMGREIEVDIGRGQVPRAQRAAGAAESEALGAR